MKKLILIVIYCLTAALLFSENITILPFENHTGNDTLNPIVENMEEITTMNLLLLNDHTLLDAPGFRISHEPGDLESFSDYSNSTFLIMGEQFYRDDMLIIGISMYDSRMKSMIFEEQHEVPSLLDSFEITDGIILSLISKIRGREVQFASFNLEKSGADADFQVFLNDVRVGENSTEVKNIITGEYLLKVVTRRNGFPETLFEEHIILQTGAVETYVFHIPEAGATVVAAAGVVLDLEDLQPGDQVHIETVDGYIYDGTISDIDEGKSLTVGLSSGAKAVVALEKMTLFENRSREERIIAIEERQLKIERWKNRTKRVRIGMAIGPMYYPESGNWSGPSGASFDFFTGAEFNLAIDFLDHHSLLFSYSRHGYWGDYPLVQTESGTTDDSSYDYKVRVHQDTRNEFLLGYGYRFNLTDKITVRPSLYGGVIKETLQIEYENTTLDMDEWYDQGEYGLEYLRPAIVGSLDVFFFYNSFASLSVSARYCGILHNVSMGDDDFSVEIPGTAEKVEVKYDYGMDTFSLRFGVHLAF